MSEVRIIHFEGRVRAPRRALAACAALALAGVVLSGCAGGPSSTPNDPYESFNRQMFALNLKLDRNVAKPLAQGYVDVVPQLARDGIHNFLTNLNQPVIFVNNVLQGEPDDAGDTFGRFFIDSTVGIGGLVDVASMWGVPNHKTDFGITLGRWGVGPGPYLMLPLLGPSDPRDLLGKGVDSAFDPSTWITYRGSMYFNMGRGFLGIVDARAQNLGTLESLQQSSVDFYATTRNLYTQYRKAQVNQGKPDVKDLPNF